MTTDPFEDRDQFLQETIDRLRAENEQLRKDKEWLIKHVNALNSRPKAANETEPT